jgi:hypothetical protein
VERTLRDQCRGVHSITTVPGDHSDPEPNADESDHVERIRPDAGSAVVLQKQFSQ